MVVERARAILFSVGSKCDLHLDHYLDILFATVQLNECLIKSMNVLKMTS